MRLYDSLTFCDLWHYVLVCDTEWQCVIVYNNMWYFKIFCDKMWHFTLYDSLKKYMSVWGRVWQYVEVCETKWQCFASVTVFDSVSHNGIVCDTEWLCVTFSDNMWYILTVCDNVWHIIFCDSLVKYMRVWGR